MHMNAPLTVRTNADFILSQRSTIAAAFITKDRRRARTALAHAVTAETFIYDFFGFEIPYKKTVFAGVDAHVYKEGRSSIIAILLTESESFGNFSAVYFFIDGIFFTA